MTVRSLKILADQIAPMQWMLVQTAIERCQNASVVARGVPVEQLSSALEVHEPDVLILGGAETLSRPELFEPWLQDQRPARRIITLFDGPQSIELRHWQVSTHVLSNPSLGVLARAIEEGV